jgi:hypothetical protein
MAATVAAFAPGVSYSGTYRTVRIIPPVHFGSHWTIQCLFRGVPPRKCDGLDFVSCRSMTQNDFFGALYLVVTANLSKLLSARAFYASTGILQSGARRIPTHFIFEPPQTGAKSFIYNFRFTQWLPPSLFILFRSYHLRKASYRHVSQRDAIS